MVEMLIEMFRCFYILRRRRRKRRRKRRRTGE
jgi:hypothetical protein